MTRKRVLTCPGLLVMVDIIAHIWELNFRYQVAKIKPSLVSMDTALKRPWELPKYLELVEPAVVL